MTADIVILGCLGNCIDIMDAVKAGGGTVRGFLDDNAANHGRVVAGHPVLGPLAMARELHDCSFVNGIGSPRSYKIKADIIARAGVPESRFASVLHPSAVVSPSARIGRGSVLLGNVTVCAQAEIGNHVMILPNSVVGHDCRIGSYVTMAAGVILSGGIDIGDAAYLGAGAVVKDGGSIGAGALLGMGAILLGAVPENETFVGNPARRLSPPKP